MSETTHARTGAAPGQGPRVRRASARPPGARRATPRHELVAAILAAGSAPEGALRAAWLSGFWTGAATVAPDRVRRCAACAEPFVADHRREIYCGARCRNRVMQRRYRARVQARGSGQPVEG
jgi:hypothetical protein